MPNGESSANIVKLFWDSLGRRDLDACVACLADNVVRIGPRQNDPADTIRGKQAYTEYLKSILDTMPAYANKTHVALGSADGRKGFIHVTEVVAVGPGEHDRFDVFAALLCDINSDNLIEKIDIFWKQPDRELEWTKGHHLVDAAISLKQ